jgi:urea transport system permease protein
MGPLLAALLLLGLGTGPARAVDETELGQAIDQLGSSSRAKIRKAVKALGALGDPRALPALEALRDRRLVVDENGRVYLRAADGDGLIAPLTGDALSAAGLKLKTPRINNSVRRVLKPAIARLQLLSDDPQTRLAAALALAKNPSQDTATLLQQAFDQEQNAAIRNALGVALAQIELNSDDLERRIAAIDRLGEAGNTRFRAKLEQLLVTDADGAYREPDETVRQAARRALAAIDNRQLMISQAGNLFYGLSLGSVLLLAALGLAITFGLMGVINMAHGEMLMLGAYSTYVVQNLFKLHLPAWFDAYLLVAIPVAFVVSGLVGIILERTIIRHLYGRPLETLLATWGIGLILIQTVRLIFGAQNVEVANPAWLSGGVVVAEGLVLTYNRIATLIFAVLVLATVWVLLQRTQLGLNVRAVTQNRSMAAAMGINTHHVDMWTFGLGSGVAGLGGVALSQLGNVGPELGQSYIVDSFMVVVLGGVGKLAGAVAGALGLGVVNKFLEPMAGAVLGKIMVLVFLILFIQKRPQGIFALKGRAAES